MPETSISSPLARKAVALLAAVAVAAGPTWALVPPQGASALSDLAFYHPDLYVSSAYQPVAEIPDPLGSALAADLLALGVAPGNGFVDLRTGGWGTLLLSLPMIPGDGRGNALGWSGKPPASRLEISEAAWQAFAGWLTAHQGALGVAAAELGSRTVEVHVGGELVQLHVRRTVGGVPVRDSFLNAVINSGNLVLAGTRNWGAVEVPTQPAISQAAAVGAAESYLGRPFVEGYWSDPHLEVVPFSAGADPSALAVGTGLQHRLAWAMGPSFSDDAGSWEALVDAHSGEVLAFRDLNQYAKNVRGGVYPVSNDGNGAEGVEHPGYPMPFADILDDASNLFHTDSGGDLVCAGEGSSIRTSLAGKFVRINDNCGAINELAADPADLDLEQGPGTDCAAPPGHSPGDTHSSRTGFYEVNRIKEMARGWLPDNPWLNAQLTSNMNIDEDCNAFWSSGTGTINFYTSGGGCRNTGEIAAVFDHEWGHGMDRNDANQFISAPGEAYADVASLLRLDDSCVARGFDALDDPCGGNGDACLSCSGVREADWMKRASGIPHNLDWNQQDPLDPNGLRGGCRINGVGSTSFGPCNNGTHCEGSMASEVIWDLLKRDLPCSGAGWENVSGSVGGGRCTGGAGQTVDFDTSRELLSRYFYLSGGLIGNWYNCNPVGPAGSYGDGCNADGAYLNFLAVDDDNGDLTDGTPHMTALFDAFDRHQIACPTPAPADSGCAGAPAVAPTVSLTAKNKGATLTWSPVAGAEKYWIFRTDGVKGCDFGKIRVGETTASSFVDKGLRNGREYFYGVIAVGASDACLGPMSACNGVIPGGAGGAIGFADERPELTDLAGGDGDFFIDNCEVGTVRFAVDNLGEVALSNVRVANVEPVSHPETEIFPAPVIAASLSPCSSAEGSFQFRAAGLGFNDTLRLRIDLTADELAPAVISREVSFVATESDFVPVASRTWSFDSDREDWTLVSGVFDHNSGLGGNGTFGYLASSSFQDNQCDQVESPIISLTDTSTLSLYNQFTIEPGTPALGFYDRANVGVRDLATNARPEVAPDGGRLYNASGPAGACVTTGQQGWSDVGATFVESTWSAAALNPGGAFTGKAVTLSVAYGTDPNSSLDGFQFDQVTLTDFEAQGPDGQDDACQVEPNEPPEAADDHATTEEQTAVDIAVLANDSDPDGDPLTVSSLTQPANGSAVINPDNTITYTPAAGFTSPPDDSFTYEVCDPGPLCDVATVTVTVTEDTDPGACGEIDDGDQAVEYRTGWHRRHDAAASNGGYHRRMGSHGGGNASTPIARVVFEGDEVTYFYVESDIGGTADIYIDGALQETLSYGADRPGPENPSFGHSRTYSGLGAGAHELLIEHRTGAVYVDGFGFACEEQAGADAAAAGAHSETETSSASAGEGPVIERTVTVGAYDEGISVVVEGSLVPVTVNLLAPSGALVASGGALIDGLAVSGLDAVPASTGVYRVQVINAPGAFSSIEISVARTVGNP